MFLLFCPSVCRPVLPGVHLAPGCCRILNSRRARTPRFPPHLVYRISSDYFSMQLRIVLLLLFYYSVNWKSLNSHCIASTVCIGSFRCVVLPYFAFSFTCSAFLLRRISMRRYCRFSDVSSAFCSFSTRVCSCCCRVARPFVTGCIAVSLPVLFLFPLA